MKTESDINKETIEKLLRILNDLKIRDKLDEILKEAIFYDLGVYCENRKYTPTPHNLLKLEDYHICYTYDVLNGNKADYDYKDIELFNDLDQDHLAFCGHEVLLFNRQKYTTYQNVKDYTCVERI